VSLALGAEATFVARSIDSDRKHLTAVLRAAAAHEGTAFVEIYQNCNIFNDGAFEMLKESGTRDEFLIRLEHGEPIRWGADGHHGVVRAADGRLQVVDVDASNEGGVLVHDAHADDPASPSRSPRAGRRPQARRPWASSAPSSGRPTTRSCRGRSSRLRRPRARRPHGPVAGADTWTID
jgi:2-oxoglutarate ferredoxin oxidoreductase subunit beta